MPSTVVSIANEVINPHLQTQNGVHTVAALVPTIPGAQGNRGSLLYCRDMIRIRADVVPGYTASNALGPDGETWPIDGEIDFPEGELNGAILCWRGPRPL